MTRVDDMRKALEATIGNLTPSRAQELAKGFLEPGAAKEQIAKTAADLMEWSQRNRQRLRSAIQDGVSRFRFARWVSRPRRNSMPFASGSASSSAPLA